MSCDFDGKLVYGDTPWAACAALEGFFSRGGDCKVSDETNWIGIVETCARKAQPDMDGQKPDIANALGWAYLAISIRESLASGFSRDEAIGLITGAMRVRADMVARCGDQPGDFICDCTKIKEWCLGLPSVQRALRMDRVPTIIEIDSDVRCVADILSYLVEEKHLKLNGDTAKLISLISSASRK